MKYSFILLRIETTAITVDFEANTADEAYEKAQDMLEDEDNPVDWDTGEVIHAEEEVLFNELPDKDALK